MEVEDGGIALFFFGFSGIKSLTGDGENVTLTAGNTRFIVTDKNYSRILYTKLYSAPPKTFVPIKK